MEATASHDINRLVGEYLYLEERWQDKPSTFDWTELEAVAKAGANAYNEGKGLSFHILALDGMNHAEFHEKFLRYSLEAGFDPFKLVLSSNGTTLMPVLNHRDLAESARHNPASTRMRELLQQKARERFSGGGSAGYGSREGMESALALCSDSIPQDLMDKLLHEPTAIAA